MKAAHLHVSTLRRFTNTKLLIIALLLSTTTAHAAQTQLNKDGINHNGSVIGDDVLYSIGGGRAVSMSGAAAMDSITVGAGWDTNLICGDMSLNTTLQNQLNGATSGFKSIMGNVIQNATNAVASLPALIIQRADPGLYNLLTNGILQARLDFDRSKSTCRAVAERMANVAGGQLAWGELAEGMALSNTVKNHDAVAAVEQAEKHRGNNGVPWVGGRSAGGKSQPSIKVVSDVTRAGFNLLNGRDVGSRSPIPKDSCGNSLSCQTWSSPQEAEAWATRVLGEREHQTCDNCTKTQTKPGVGLTPLIQEEYDAKLQILEALVKTSDTRWCSDGFEFRCEDGAKLSVTFALDCCDREAIGWVASPTGYSGDDIRDLMLESVEKRFGDQLPTTPVQWLSDNGSAYTAEQTRLFARQIGLQPVTTPVRSPQSNGMAESFVKTIKRDYVAHMPKPDRETALRNLAIAFEHYNEQHPHSALNYRSPREFRRLAAASI